MTNHANIGILAGYRPGLIGRVTEMHASYYAANAGFGQYFEAVVARGLASFCDRLNHPRNSIWVATRDDHIVGSIAIDGEDLGEGLAHLRWFILDDAFRGTGLGKALLATALRFVDDLEFRETHLWTFKGLEAARHLYDRAGFSCIEEYAGDQWGQLVLEQRLARPHPGPA